MADDDKHVWQLADAPDPAQDRPIEQESDDLLDRGPFVESLARALVKDVHDESGKLVARKSTGFVVGLTGSWGLGKSSVLNLLALHLGAQENVIVAKFNPWLFKGRDELLAAFFNLIGQAMGRTNTEEARQLMEALDRYRRAIEMTAHAVAAGIDVMGGSGAATAAATATFKWWKREPSKLSSDPIKSISEERNRLEKKLQKLNSAVVVLIDELDRVEDEDVRAVAQLVKAVGDIQGISYLVAYDPKRVAEALGQGTGSERLASGYSYLEKIIQHPIPMRPLFTEDVDKLLQSALNAHKLQMAEGDAEEDKEILNLLKRELSTPREIKRLIGSFAVIEEAVRGEVNPTHVLGYCWILTKAPELRARIAADLDKYVDDPSENEMLRRAYSEVPSGKQEEITKDDLLGPAAKEFEPLLKRLFPRFGERRQQEDGTRLSRRRNLVRVLYLGNAPGMVTRKDIEEIWKLPTAEIEAGLLQLHSAGALSSFLDRLDDLLPRLPQSADARFWTALSRALIRQYDWIQGPEPERHMADDAATSLFRLGLRSKKNVPRVKLVVEELIKNGDLLFAPWIVRKHMFSHGFVPGESARGGSTLYDKEQTGKLIEREMPRYREALLNGTLLRRVPNVEAFFALKNGGFWDAELFKSLSDQLQTHDAIYTIAALFTPPGHIIDRKTIAQLLDIEQLMSLILSLPPPADAWMALAFKRFRLTLEGKAAFHTGRNGRGRGMKPSNSGDTQFRGHNTKTIPGTQQFRGHHNNSGDTILISSPAPIPGTQHQFRGHNTN